MCFIFLIDAVEHMQRSHQQRETPDATKAHNVRVESSNVEYVIIGDNNYMNIESSLDETDSATEDLDPEETDSLPEDLEG